MKFGIEVENSKGDKWKETYDDSSCTDYETIYQFASALAKKFNDTLRHGELKRYFTGYVFIIGEGKKESWNKPHRWTKSTLITQYDHRGTFDPVMCDDCDATGRRYGIGTIKRSDKFRAKKWAFCPGKKGAA